MVIIELDRPRELRFGFKALKMIKAMTKKSVPEIMREVEESNTPFMDEKTFETFMYCGLKANDEELKLENIEDVLDKADYSYVREKMMEAIFEAYGKTERKEVTETKKK